MAALGSPPRVFRARSMGRTRCEPNESIASAVVDLKLYGAWHLGVGAGTVAAPSPSGRPTRRHARSVGRDVLWRSRPRGS